jgi:NAD(P)-dependent dehydrogenase (short-subunit alcohol dehydrogenase family)
MFHSLDLMERVGLIVGASRGIGRAITVKLAAEGWNLCICSKDQGTLPGSLQETLDAAAAVNPQVRIIAHSCDVRVPEQVMKVIELVMDHFGRIDCLVYNAGAVHWDSVSNTSFKKYELLHQVNSRGSFTFITELLPILKSQKTGGRIVLLCPPVYQRFLRGKVVYAMSKLSMSILVLGLGYELGVNNKVIITGLWPATGIKSYVTDKMNVELSKLRKPEIMADAVAAITNELISERIQGKLLIDEDYLKELNPNKNFSDYSCIPNVSVPRMMPKAFPNLTVVEEEVEPLFQTKSKL